MKKIQKSIIYLTTMNSMFAVMLPYFLVSCCKPANEKIMLVNNQTNYVINTALPNIVGKYNPFKLGQIPSIAFINKMLMLNQDGRFKNKNVDRFIKSLFTNVPKEYEFKVTNSKFVNRNYVISVVISEKRNLTNAKTLTLTLTNVTPLTNKNFIFRWKGTHLEPNIFGNYSPKNVDELITFFNRSKLNPTFASFLTKLALPKLEDNETYSFLPGKNRPSFELIEVKNQKNYQLMIDVKCSNSEYNRALLTLKFENVPQNVSQIKSENKVDIPHQNIQGARSQDSSKSIYSQIKNNRLDEQQSISSSGESSGLLATKSKNNLLNLEVLSGQAPTYEQLLDVLNSEKIKTNLDLMFNSDSTRTLTYQWGENPIFEKNPDNTWDYSTINFPLTISDASGKEENKKTVKVLVTGYKYLKAKKEKETLIMDITNPVFASESPEKLSYFFDNMANDSTGVNVKNSKYNLWASQLFSNLPSSLGSVRFDVSMKIKKIKRYKIKLFFHEILITATAKPKNKKLPPIIARQPVQVNGFFWKFILLDTENLIKIAPELANQEPKKIAEGLFKHLLQDNKNNKSTLSTITKLNAWLHRNYPFFNNKAKWNLGLVKEPILWEDWGDDHIYCIAMFHRFLTNKLKHKVLLFVQAKNKIKSTTN